MEKGAGEGLPRSHHLGNLTEKNKAFCPLKPQRYPSVHQVPSPVGRSGSTSHLLDLPKKGHMEENPLDYFNTCY